MLFLIIGSILLVAIVALLLMKQPKLTPKKTIVETILAANDLLFTYRQDVRSIVSDNLSLHQNHDINALQTRYTTLAGRKHTIEQSLSVAENGLDAYRSLKVHATFYKTASAALGALRQALLVLDGLYGDSVTLQPVVADIQTLSEMTQDPAMTTYLADDTSEPAGQVANHVSSIIAHANNVISRLQAIHPQTHEYGNICRAIMPILEQVRVDYEKLHNLLSDQQYDAYRNASQALPLFLGRFNPSSYDTIATSSFADTGPEESFINDLRPYLYE